MSQTFMVVVYVMILLALSVLICALVQAWAREDRLYDRLTFAYMQIAGYRHAIKDVTKHCAENIDPNEGPDEHDGFWSEGWECRLGYVKNFPKGE